LLRGILSVRPHIQRCTIKDIPDVCTVAAANHFQPIMVKENLRKLQHRTQLLQDAIQLPVESIADHDVHVLQQMLGRSRIQVLRKMPGWHTPFWDKVIAPAVGCRDMLVESWLHGPGALDNHCSADGCTVNANGMHFGNVSWNVFQDHSKWSLCCDAVVVCVGDMNREYAQAYRGGLAVCLTGNPLHLQEHSDVASAFRQWLASHMNSYRRCCSPCTCNKGP
jgi:hypothetical protein